MRGVHSAVDDIRRNVFTEVARLGYEGGDLTRVDALPYTLIQGEVAHHRHDVFLERAIVFPADRILLDSGQGTGRTFDWSLLRHFPRPYLLAGGLDPENLPTAIRTLHPYGVDLSSGVETDGLKDFTKIQAAVAAAREE